MAMATGDERDAVADEDGHDADHELVDRLCIEERGDDLAAAHEPDVLARLRPQSAHERADCLVHELDAARHAGRWRLVREDDRPLRPIELAAELEAFLISLSAEYVGVDRLHEIAHAVEAIRLGPG